MIKKLTCIECPLGCQIEIELNEKGESKVTGNGCPRGKLYAVTEITCPKRVITTTIRLADGGVLPVKTSNPVKKENIFAVMQKINALNCFQNIKSGDIIVKDIEEGVDLIATADS